MQEKVCYWCIVYWHSKYVVGIWTAAYESFTVSVDVKMKCDDEEFTKFHFTVLRKYRLF